MSASSVRRARKQRLVACALTAIIAATAACSDPAKVGDRRSKEPSGSHKAGAVHALDDGWVARVARDTGERTFERVAKAVQPSNEVAKVVNEFFESTKNFQSRWRTDRWVNEHTELLKRLKRPANSDITIDSFRPLEPAECELVPYLVDYPIAPCALLNITVASSEKYVEFPHVVLVKELGRWKLTDSIACDYLPELPCANRQWNRP